MSIDVLAPGMLTTVQDGGRRGHSALGVGGAGAMDTVALRLANLLVGNADDAAALEITLRGPRLRLRHDTLIAITGADIDAHCGDATLPAWRPLAIRAGAEIAFGGVRRGARSYLAVSGGIGGTAVLGSRSADVNAGIGGPALAAGDTLSRAQAGEPTNALWRQLNRERGVFAATSWQLDPQPWFDPDCARPIRVVTGAHFPQLNNAAQRALFATEFAIGSASNRVGYRLEGGTLAPRPSLELISEGVVPGTVQLPPGGTPIVLMAEAPTCGGYPRIAQVIAIDLPRLAQRRPGDHVRFAETSLADAQTRYLERELALRKIARYVMERLNA